MESSFIPQGFKSFSILFPWLFFCVIMVSAGYGLAAPACGWIIPFKNNVRCPQFLLY
jgi:hypothetical protein